MKIAVLGTGMVGQTLAAGLAGIGHDVTVGTRDVAAASARTGVTAMGTPEFGTWCADHPEVAVATIADAAASADLVVLAVAGTAAVEAISRVGAETLAGMTVVDVTNPLDFSGGVPPSLSVCNTDSLAEQLQRSFPQVHIVKTLNTVTAPVMVNPDAVGGGDHTMFLAGDDEAAKAEVLAVLTALGWRDVVDLGDITAARGMEMYLPLWLRMFGTLGSPMYSIKVVR